MGDPKKIRKSYITPSHPWQRERIAEEKVLIREFGLKNHKELWMMRTFVKKASNEAKKLIPLRTEQAEKERKLLMDRLVSLGLLPKGSILTDILNLEIRHILERRLQTIIFRKGLARTISQARQMITHGHVSVADRVVTAPSYLVKVSEEKSISFSVKSPFISEFHPERAQKGGVTNG